MKRRILVLGLLMLVGWSGMVRGEDTTEVRHKIAVRLAGAWDVVQGDDDYWFHSGLGYNLQLMVPISRSFAIIGNLGKSGQKMTDLPRQFGSSFTTYESDLEFSSYRYSAGLRYITRSLFGWKRTKFYMDLTAGKLYSEYSGRALLEDSTGQPGYVLKPNSHDPDLLVEWETGLQMRITSGIAAEFGIRRYLSFYKASGNGTTMNQDFGFCLGVTVGFGKKE
ncbi:MAG: hypothetical protein IPH75_14110 [bacterium]|nr:hypothetical protein [bacterium]